MVCELSFKSRTSQACSMQRTHTHTSVYTNMYIHIYTHVHMQEMEMALKAMETSNDGDASQVSLIAAP